jgi:hypothetical protein
MKLTIQDRLELKRILKGYNSDKTSEIELVKDIFDKVGIPQEERVKFGITESLQCYQIEFEQEEDLSFETQELALLKKIHGLIEANSRVNLDNLSLCKKLRDIEVSQS